MPFRYIPRRLALIVLHATICAVLHQRLYHPLVPLLRGDVQPGRPLHVTRVHARARVQQHLQNGHVTLRGVQRRLLDASNQRRRPVHVHAVDVRARLDQHLDALRVPVIHLKTNGYEISITKYIIVFIRALNSNVLFDD
eukprot:8545859-Pyramimonas_sp.AAC.1